MRAGIPSDGRQGTLSRRERARVRGKETPDLERGAGKFHTARESGSGSEVLRQVRAPARRRPRSIPVPTRDRPGGVRGDEQTSAQQVKVNAGALVGIRDILHQGFFIPGINANPGILAYVLLDRKSVV